jgi:hypothetical protein
MAKKTRRGQKQCRKCKTWVKGTRAKTCPKCSYEFMSAKHNGKAVTAKPVAVPEPVAEKPAKPGDTLTLEHVKAVAKTVKDIGGFNRLSELLGTIKEVGGMKKFKDLMEAMVVPEADDIKF